MTDTPLSPPTQLPHVGESYFPDDLDEALEDIHEKLSYLSLNSPGVPIDAPSTLNKVSAILHEWEERVKSIHGDVYPEPDVTPLTPDIPDLDTRKEVIFALQEQAEVAIEELDAELERGSLDTTYPMSEGGVVADPERIMADLRNFVSVQMSRVSIQISDEIIDVEADLDLEPEEL
jgi:hypothetical protein